MLHAIGWPQLRESAAATRQGTELKPMPHTPPGLCSTIVDSGRGTRVCCMKSRNPALIMHCCKWLQLVWVPVVQSAVVLRTCIGPIAAEYLGPQLRQSTSGPCDTVPLISVHAMPPSVPLISAHQSPCDDTIKCTFIGSYAFCEHHGSNHEMLTRTTLVQCR
jgi:hypothetical protein